MTHSLPAGNSEVIGETDSQKNTKSRETVICAKKGVREEEMNFPWRVLESIVVFPSLLAPFEQLGCWKGAL